MLMDAYDEDEDYNYLSQDSTLLRFLRARDHSIDKSSKMLMKSLIWRRTNVNSEDLICHMCADDPTNHCFLLVGRSKENHPIVYANPGRDKQLKNPSSQVKHIVCVLERTFKVARVADKWIWVVDFKGFTAAHAFNVELGKQVVNLFANNYPERLYTLVLLVPPTVFQVLWKVLSKMIDKGTVKKVRMVSKQNEVAPLCEELFEEGVSDWIQKAVEMDAKPGNLPPLPACAEPFQWW
eukprot:Platyproteum_vivax@DN12606_c0_g1_i1.p2